MNLIAKKGGYVLIGKKTASKPMSVKQAIPEAYNKSPLERG